MLIFEPLRKYATFSGRARRSEYWLFMLFASIITWVLSGLAYPTSVSVMSDAFVWQVSSSRIIHPLWGTVLAIFLIAVAIPSIAVAVRRLHDIDRSGWWWLLSLTGIGGIVLFIFFLLDGTHGPNRFGPDPKGRPTPFA